MTNSIPIFYTTLVVSINSFSKNVDDPLNYLSTTSVVILHLMTTCLTVLVFEVQQSLYFTRQDIAPMLSSDINLAELRSYEAVDSCLYAKARLHRFLQLCVSQ